MPLDYEVQTTSDTGCGIPEVESTVQYLLDLGYKFQCSFNQQADSMSIHFITPLNDFRVSQVLRTKGWLGTPTKMSLKNLTKYRPKYHSPNYQPMDGHKDYLINTGPEMTPDPSFISPLKSMAD